MKTKNIYKIEEKDNRLYVDTPYSDYMCNFYRSINARWKKPYWVVNKNYYDILMNELRYLFGSPDDIPVDLKIDVSRLAIRDRLTIAGIKCIQIDSLEKKFMQTSNLYIYEKYAYDNWQKVNYSGEISKSFFTRLIVGYFRPFKMENCTLLLTNISKTRAQNFIDANHSWVKSSSIVLAKNNNFYE